MEGNNDDKSTLINSLEKTDKDINFKNLTYLESEEKEKHVNLEKTVKKDLKTEEKESIKDPFEELLKEHKIETQKFEANDTILEKEIEEEEEEIVEVSTSKKELKNKVGKGIFLTVNGICTTGAALIADEPTGKFQLDKETREEIEQGFTDLSEAYGWEKGLPAWIPLTVLMLTAYGTMFHSAYGIRKEKEKEKKQKEALKKKIEKTAKIDENLSEKKEVDLSDFDIKTEFEIPKKSKRGADTKEVKELKEVIKNQQKELEKATKIVKTAITE